MEYEKEYFTINPYHPYGNYECYEQRANKLVTITHPRNVLDVGCAYGYIVMYLVNKGIPAMGCDISEWCRQQAESVIPDRFRKCLAWDLFPFQDKSFDLIYCEGVLEHIPEDKIDRVFQEFRRVANRFYIQISFSSHKGFGDEPGHQTCHEAAWWGNKMPPYTLMALDECGTQDCINWLFKSE